MHASMIVRTTATWLVALLVTAGAQARGIPPNIVTGDAGPPVPSPIVKYQVNRLNGKINWIKSLDEAKRLAQSSNKPIFWVHVLGEINGDCCSAFQSMRAVSLSNEAVLNALRTHFVCGYKNITGEPYAGASGRHETDGQAVETTNGAGPHNVQLFMLHADGTVLHCLPGFWSPADLLREMRFALTLKKTWENSSLALDRKKELFKQANLRDIYYHPADMVARSHLQSFDARHERQKPDSDFKFKPGDYRPSYATWNKKTADLKTTDQVVHERMAQRPFVPYDEFDVEKFSDYGQLRYDKNEDFRGIGPI